MRAWLLAVALALSCCGDPPQSSAPIPLPPGERVYVVNTRATTMTVIDAGPGTVAGEVELGLSPHGLAAAPNGRMVYITGGHKRGSVVAVDTQEHRVRWRLKLGPEPHQPAVSQDGQRLFVPDFSDGHVYVVDLVTGSLKTRIPVTHAGKPANRLHNAYTGNGVIYVTIMGSRALALLDDQSGVVTRTLDLAGEPRPLAISEGEHRAYVQFSNWNGFATVDLATAEELARTAWSEPGQVDDVWTPAHGIHASPDGGELWALSKISNSAHVHALPGLELLAEVPLQDSPAWIAFSSDGTRVYITNAAPTAPRGSVSIIDRATRAVLGTLPVGKAPKRIVAVTAP